MYLRVKYKKPTSTELIHEGKEVLAAFPGFGILSHEYRNVTALTALGTAIYLRNKDATEYIVVVALFFTVTGAIVLTSPRES